MIVSDLKEHYGEHYNNAYYEIKELLKSNGFEGYKEVRTLARPMI